MSHVKSAFKKLILLHLNQAKQFPYFRSYTNDNGDFVIIWHEEGKTYFVAEGNTLEHPSFQDLEKIPMDKRAIFDSIDRSFAADAFINILERKDAA